MTQVLDLATIIRCFVEAETFLGKNRKWNTCNPFQDTFITKFLKRFLNEVAVMADMKVKASSIIAELNAFLRENGFNIQLQEMQNKGVGIVSILDRRMLWSPQAAASNKVLKGGGMSYPGFRLAEAGVSFYEVDHEPLVGLKTQSGDTLWIRPNAQSYSGLNLAEQIFTLSQLQKKIIYDFGGVHLPQVMIDVKPDIGFLCGMNTYDKKDQYWFIGQALQQAKFAMNKEGAKLKVATAMTFERSVREQKRPKPDLIVNEPFYLWLQDRGGSLLPIGTMYVTQDCWKLADLNAL